MNDRLTNLLVGRVAPSLYRLTQPTATGEIAQRAANHGWRFARLDGRQIASKAAFVAAFAAALDFPAYFGHNWDALADSVRDLSWAPAERGYLVLYEDAGVFAAAAPMPNATPSPVAASELWIVVAASSSASSMPSRTTARNATANRPQPPVSRRAASRTLAARAARQVAPWRCIQKIMPVRKPAARISITPSKSSSARPSSPIPAAISPPAAAALTTAAATPYHDEATQLAATEAPQRTQQDADDQRGFQSLAQAQ